MMIQLNTDKHIHGTETLEASVRESVSHALKHYAERITRIEVHFTDQNAAKAGADDIQCKLEARPEGLQPILVSAKSDSKEKSLNLALDKMKAALSSVIGKQKDN